MTSLNEKRGETLLIIDGKPRRLCLTLGALADIEAALNLDNLHGWQRRFQNLSARDFLAVLAALLKGGGEEFSSENLARASLNFTEAGEAVARAFTNASPEEPSETMDRV